MALKSPEITYVPGSLMEMPLEKWENLSPFQRLDAITEAKKITRTVIISREWSIKLETIYRYYTLRKIKHGVRKRIEKRGIKYINLLRLSKLTSLEGQEELAGKLLKTAIRRNRSVWDCGEFIIDSTELKDKVITLLESERFKKAIILRRRKNELHD